MERQNSIPRAFMRAVLLLSVFASVTCNSSAGSAQGEKVVRIGIVANLGASIGYDMTQGIRVMAAQDNAAGGLEIGGEKYKVELITYDTANSQAQEVATINRLIYEDKVKYIISTEDYVGGWIDIAEENRVITLGFSTTDLQLSPKYHYSFNPNFNRSGNSIVIGWLCNKYPDLAKNVVFAYPDNQIGHTAAKADAPVWKAFGAKLKTIFYPSDTTDLSALGTKVRMMKPSVFGASGGAGPADALAVKAAYDAGYRGQMISNTSAPAMAYAAIAKKDAVEGILMGAAVTEFDNPPTEVARKFKQAWIDTYGSWEGPELMGVGSYACLRTALMQTGSLDTDALADCIAGGMEFEGPTGTGKMVSRPDLNNPRTVDSVTTVYIKTIKDGKAVLIDQVPLEQGVKYFRLAFPEQ